MNLDPITLLNPTMEQLYLEVDKAIGSKYSRLKVKQGRLVSMALFLKDYGQRYPNLETETSFTIIEENGDINITAKFRVCDLELKHFEKDFKNYREIYSKPALYGKKSPYRSILFELFKSFVKSKGTIASWCFHKKDGNEYDLELDITFLLSEQN